VITKEVPFLDLSRQYQQIRPEIDQAVARTLTSGRYILGEEVAAFEQEFAAFCGTRHAVGVGSGTEALHLALRACDVRPGDVVITAANTAVPTVCAIVAAGAHPILVDIEPRTLTLDAEKLRARLRAQPPPLRVTAIIPVHMYGHPSDMKSILEVASEFGLKVVEDAAQAHGAEYAGKKVGCLGHAGCFSFYPTKNLGAFGDGGIVVTDDDQVANQVRMLRNYGEEAKYRSRIPGCNSRLDEIQAAVLRVKLKYLEQWTSMRRGYARLYGEMLGSVPLILPTETPSARHVYHLYVVRAEQRDRLQRHLQEHGIGTSVHYPVPVASQHAYRELGNGDGGFPHAERACHQVLSLPLYPELTEEEIRQVTSAIGSFY